MNRAVKFPSKSVNEQQTKQKVCYVMMMMISCFLRHNTNPDMCSASGAKTVSAFPQTYQETIGSPGSENWKAAMREEMDSLENDKFILTTLPEGRNSVRGPLGVHYQRRF